MTDQTAVLYTKEQVENIVEMVIQKLFQRGSVPTETILDNSIDIFTGSRSGELIGLTWDCVDFENGLIRVVKQLLLPRKKGKYFAMAL